MQTTNHSHYSTFKHVFCSSMSRLTRSVADLTAGDDEAYNSHRVFFPGNSSGMEDRSSMTLPHRKNNSTPSGPLIRAALPSHLQPMSQSQVMDLDLS